VREANTDEDIRVFTEMYHDNMRRVHAGENYFFDTDYFKNLLCNTCYQTKLLFAVRDKQIAAGAIFIITNTYMQYHLAATKQEYIAESPMKLLVDEARNIANSLHLEYFHLGGSVGDSNEDPLFRFKSGFSKERFSFRVWQYVHDENAYAQLNKLYGKHDTTSNYFPLYRS
jgi:lipid II:glycine glycyltransferase (peptidoglycan interpeptide bridge formation enzyme)